MSQLVELPDLTMCIPIYLAEHLITRKSTSSDGAKILMYLAKIRMLQNSQPLKLKTHNDISKLKIAVS